MVCLAETMHVSCTDTNTVSKHKEARFQMTQVTWEFHGCVQNDIRASGMFGASRAPIFRQDYHYLQTDRNELALEPYHLVVPSSASKMISEPMVRLAHTMHLSCIDTNTVSKQKEVRLHMTNIT